MQNYKAVVPPPLLPAVKDLPGKAGWSPKMIDKKGDAMFVMASPKKKREEKLYPLEIDGERHPNCYIWIDTTAKSLPPPFGSKEQIKLAKKGSKHGMVVFYPQTKLKGKLPTPIEIGSPAATRAIRSLFDAIKDPKALTKKKRPLENTEKLELVNCTYEFLGNDPYIRGTLDELGFRQVNRRGAQATFDPKVIDSMYTDVDEKLKNDKTRIRKASPEGKRILNHFKKAQSAEYKKVSPTEMQRRQGYVSYLETVSKGPDVFGKDVTREAQKLYRQLSPSFDPESAKDLPSWQAAAQKIRVMADGAYKKYKGKMPSVTAPYDNATGEMMLGTKANRTHCNIYGFVPGNLGLNKKHSACRESPRAYRSKKAFKKGSQANIVEGLEGGFGNISSFDEYINARNQFGQNLGADFNNFTKAIQQPSSFSTLLRNPEYFTPQGLRDPKRPKKVKPEFISESVSTRAPMSFANSDLVAGRSPFGPSQEDDLMTFSPSPVIKPTGKRTRVVESDDESASIKRARSEEGSDVESSPPAAMEQPPLPSAFQRGSTVPRGRSASVAPREQEVPSFPFGLNSPTSTLDTGNLSGLKAPRKSARASSRPPVTAF